jgi:glycosyltransferase involved in cell wall biosynthesis
VKPQKGGALLPSIISAASQAEWHVFGGGDGDLLRDVRRHTSAKLHGYYRASKLPSLLVRHRIGLAVLPSIVPEAFGLTLSECWLARVPVIAFDLGALGERIATHGGGWVVPLSEGAEGIADKVRAWMAGRLSTAVPIGVPSARDAALAHMALYRELRLL